MKNKSLFHISLMLLCFHSLVAQVQVSKEPHHHLVIENEYIRLLNVWLEPGDTTQFHTHSTPSLFIHLSDSKIQTQEKGKSWVPETTTAGKTWYKPFSPDKLVHRVCNADTEEFHVMDIELVSAYDRSNQIPDVPQPFPVIMDNEKAYAYGLNSAVLKGRQIVSPAPMIAVLVSGGPVTFNNEMMAQSSEMRPGQFMYIDTGTFFSFSFEDKTDINMVLFELK